jgi:hypothetical protein
VAQVETSLERNGKENKWLYVDVPSFVHHPSAKNRGKVGNVSENTISTTELTSQYIAQVASDLERNAKEQERLSAEITALQEQLLALQHDHTVLVNMQQTLGAAATGASAQAASEEAAAPSAPSLPRQKTAPEPGSGKKAGAKKTATAQGTKTAKKSASAKKTAVTKAADKKTATKKTAAEKAVAQKAVAEKPTAKADVTKADATKANAAKAAKPTLVELIRQHLTEQSEPRSAAEVATALGQAHPDRSIKTTVVRTSLEGLVARSRAHRTKQGSSVFYSAPDTPDTPEPKAASQTESQPAETAKTDR